MLTNDTLAGQKGATNYVALVVHAHWGTRSCTNLCSRRLRSATDGMGSILPLTMGKRYLQQHSICHSSSVSIAPIFDTSCELLHHSFHQGQQW